MIDFNKGSIANLRPISIDQMRKEIRDLLIDGEEPICAFQTIRDQLIFTSKRIITVDVQGLTGTRKSYAFLPYNRIQYFAIQTPGLAEFVPDNELFLYFANGGSLRFEFKGSVNVALIGRMISEYVLDP